MKSLWQNLDRKSLQTRKRVITAWLVNKQLSDRRGSGARGTHPGGTAAHAFAFDHAPLADQYQHPARKFPARSTQVARLGFAQPASEQGNIGPLAGGRFSSGTENSPAPSLAPTRYIGGSNYWAPGLFPPADTGTRWGNGLANSFASAANTALNPVVELGASIAPYSDDLDAAAMTMRGVPGYGKLAAVPFAGASAWSKAAIKAARRLDTQAEQLAKQAGHNRVELRAPSVRIEIDLAGRAHAGIATPHTKRSPRNFEAPPGVGPKYNASRKFAPTLPSTQEDVRLARKYLRR